MNGTNNDMPMIQVKIRSLREEHELSQEDVVFKVNCLAEKRIISLSGYKKIEKGLTESINYKLLDKLCELYQCGVQDILVRE
jgi:transcriptional regulator with XRE-family HTH domain